MKKRTMASACKVTRHLAGKGHSKSRSRFTSHVSEHHASQLVSRSHFYEDIKTVTTQQFPPTSNLKRPRQRQQ